MTHPQPALFTSKAQIHGHHVPLNIFDCVKWWRGRYRITNRRKILANLYFAFFLTTVLAEARPDTDFQKLREDMVEKQIQARGVRNEQVLRAMKKVPRHHFVLPQHLSLAYSDRPLPIGEGQTISQPYIVAVMTELLQIKPGDKVLEIGTGSGYQAAVLAEITKNVYTIEIIRELAERAKQKLLTQNYTCVKTKIGDGYFGWEEHAPFDAIIVTAAPTHLPPPLKRQLKDDGRMVIPVGKPGGYQTLWLIEKNGDKFQMSNQMQVSFVPFTRK